MITKVVTGICIAIPMSAILLVAVLKKNLERSRAGQTERYRVSAESHIIDLRDGTNLLRA
jgi:hypothetical protein